MWRLFLSNLYDQALHATLEIIFRGSLRDFIVDFIWSFIKQISRKRTKFDSLVLEFDLSCKTTTSRANIFVILLILTVPSF